MALITCKKCNHIYSSTAVSCPYCDTENTSHASIQLNDNRKDVRSAVIGFCLLGLLLFILFFGNSNEDNPGGTNPAQESANDANTSAVTDAKSSCSSADCPVGTAAVTRSTAQEPFYTCKSGELAEYTNYVLNLPDAQTQPEVFSRKLSDTTGVPQVEASDKSILEKYRANAGVSTFEEALSKCYKGIANMNVLVLDDPKDGSSIYVASEENQEEKFWLPKARLEPR